MSDSNKKANLNEETQDRIRDIRSSWTRKLKVSTLPAWAQVQNRIIQQCKENLPDIDEETKKKITRELLLTLRCHSCERARSDACHFSVCIRGLMSGKGVIQ